MNSEALNNKKSIVFTNDNCVGCNKCISGCPILGANVASIHNGQNKIIVNQDQCIHCGHCIDMCKHNAREYIDDTYEFLEALDNGIPMTLFVAPSFYLNYPKEANKILGYLKSRGVKRIYNVSAGADISTWALVRFMMKNPNKSYISQSCAAFVNCIENMYSNFIEYLAPVHSPLICLAIYVRKYLHENNDIAFLSPCIAKKDEIDSENCKGLVQYNVTFQHLIPKIKEFAVSKYSASSDIDDQGLGVIYPFPNGMKENVELFVDDKITFFALPTNEITSKKLNAIKDIMQHTNKPICIEALQCDNGCALGTGVDKLKANVTTIVDEYIKKKSQFSQSTINSNGSAFVNPFSKTICTNKRRELLFEKFKMLDENDFTRNYINKTDPAFELPENVLDSIYNSMHKYNTSQRLINCQSCGYESCEKMVKAIALGYNVKENCIQYEKDENYKLFTRDALTNLPNRMIFIKDINKYLKEKKLDFSIIQFNLKGFTLINKRLGFNCGNAVLREFVSEVNAKLNTDEVLYHTGGDNFFIVLKPHHVNSILFDMNHLSLSSLILSDEESLEMKVRAGVYFLDGTEIDANDVMERVASAYMVTRTKKIDTAFYDKAVSENLITSFNLSRDIVKALDNEELFVVFQPKINSAEKKLAGAEALIRWKHNGKIYSPDSFIPICEGNGFIRRIDFFVLNKVCSLIVKWIKQGLDPVKVSVNFSKLHFTQSDVADRICNIIDSWKVPHNLIEIEFTETTYTDMQDVLSDTVMLLKKQGIHSSIDDFGCGYSSLNLLQNLDFDVIKLDKSLIDTMTKNAKSKTVVTNIIKMAKELSMLIVAEGVETKQELSILEELECDMIQGFIFDKQLIVEEFEKRLIEKQYTLE